MAQNTVEQYTEEADSLVVESSPRALRRHHLTRVKHNRKTYWGFNTTDHPMSERRLGIVASTPKPCGCAACSKPRKHTSTIQELRQQQSGLQEFSTRPD
jgi:hypothetical protein